jgi:Helix-turn-helix domain
VPSLSVQAMSWVIEKSRHKGSVFVVLLVIANHAQSDGTGAWPSVETIAREARITARHVARILPKLKDSGELAIEEGSGPHGTNLYSLPGLLPSTHDNLSGDNCGSLPLTNATTAPDICGSQMSPEPSLTVIEPSGNRSAPESGAPPAQATPRPSPCAFAGTHLSISERQHHLLHQAFPWVDRAGEYRKADAWLEANPNRRPRKPAAFVHNWFSRITAPSPKTKGAMNADQRTRSNLAAARLRPN